MTGTGGLVSSSNFTSVAEVLGVVHSHDTSIPLFIIEIPHNLLRNVSITWPNQCLTQVFTSHMTSSTGH